MARDAAEARSIDRTGFTLVRGMIGEDLCALLWAHTLFRQDKGLVKIGDPALSDAPVIYGDPLFEKLLETLRDQVAARVGRSLDPTYSYVRIYRRGDVLRRHHDRPACEFGVSLNIGQVPDRPWPLHLAAPSGPQAVHLRPGDGVIYKGVEIEHWREPYEGEQLVQVFLHYVDSNGPYAGHRFDQRQGLNAAFSKEDGSA